MNSLRLRIFLMVFLVVVVAVGTVLVFAKPRQRRAVQNFVGLSAAHDQQVAVQLLSDPLRTGNAPESAGSGPASRAGAGCASADH